MCMMVYLASDRRLPTIPWEENIKQSLLVSEIDEPDKLITKYFSKKYVYDIGAFEGCGCGFKFGTLELEDEKDKEAEACGRESVEELFHFLRDHIHIGETAELYSCWAGDEGKELEHKTQIDLRGFELGNEFRFLENQIVIIIG